MPNPYPLTLIPALCLTAALLLVAHWFPMFIGDKLHRLLAYALGVFCVGVPLCWHQYTIGAQWWHYPLFFGVGGVAVVLAYGIDKLLSKTTVEAIEAHLGIGNAQRQGEE